jgi:lysophospholipase L1-like esterase
MKSILQHSISASRFGTFLCAAFVLASTRGNAAQTAAPAVAPPPQAATTQTAPVTPVPALIKPMDWPQLGRYRDANAALPPPTSGENRVIFFGDSITDAWRLADYFPGKPYINRGISGQTTQQMVIRFRQDVIALHPAVVVVLAGTNDIAGNTGPTTLEEIEGNFTSMAELARVNGIRMVLASVLPVFDYRWRPGLEPVPKIAALNEWLKNYAAAHGLIYLDYYTQMQDERHGMPASLSADGVHPNKAGYEVMTPLAEQAIAKALNE